ncbi:RELN-like protein [Mya arenaria]|uniref:Reelin n=1 Tax=Mya arenaria TaxID=6604 RepID=A0ABY7FV67_MYAAR|nr:RELN-like protein [Mya arenaria]
MVSFLEVQLLYSHDKGVTWQPVTRSCLPSHLNCEKYTFPRDSEFLSDMTSGWNRYNVPLPFHTRCDPGWGGFDCSASTIDLPVYSYDMFTGESYNWYKVVGGKRTKPCKPIASGSALHFTGNCSRGLISRFFDLSNAEYVQFNFMYGCGTPPDNIDESVLIGYSTNAVDWTTFGNLHYLNYRSPSFVTIMLPDDAKRNGTAINFAQFKNSGQNEDDWLIDNLRIGGRNVNPDMMMSDFTYGIDAAEWKTFDNIKTGVYCERSEVASGEIVDDESATITTQDLNIHEGHMLQFWYNIGCMRPWNASVAPVHLQYSTDYGMTWAYVTPQCLSNDPDCLVGPSMASVYYGDPMGRWQRVIIPLEGMTQSKYGLGRSFYIVKTY